MMCFRWIVVRAVVLRRFGRGRYKDKKERKQNIRFYSKQKKHFVLDSFLIKKD